MQELDHPYCRNILSVALAETAAPSQHFPGTVQEFAWGRTHPDRQLDAATLVWRLKSLNNTNAGHLALGPGNAASHI